MATKREQITNFLNKNGFASTFQGDQFEQVVNAIELYTSKKENRIKATKISEEDLAVYNGFATAILDMFPAIKIPTSGKYARDPHKEVVDALIWFRTTYSNFTFNTISAAVYRYVKEREVENWQFMQTCKYFIRKQQKDKSWVSSLANYCQQIDDGIEDHKDVVPDIKSRVV